MRTFAFALMVLVGGSLSAQRVETGFLDRTVTVAGSSYHYQVYVPANYTTQPKWPVILFLHGAGERGGDGLLQTAVGLAPAIRLAPGKWPAIVVLPQAPTDSQWVGTPADMALAALLQTMTEYHVDSNRVYLTGLSMGGHGTWYLAFRRPELFAAIAPLCSWVVDMDRFKGSVPVVPGDTATALATLARKLGKLPIWMFHGEVDGAVPVKFSRDAAAALKAASANVQYTEYLGMNHNVWDATYGSDAFIQWLFAQKRH